MKHNETASIHPPTTAVARRSSTLISSSTCAWCICLATGETATTLSKRECVCECVCVFVCVLLQYTQILHLSVRRHTPAAPFPRAPPCLCVCVSVCACVCVCVCVCFPPH